MALIENLRALSLANGSSGDEGAVRGAILAELAKIPDCKAFVDGIGNILAEKRGANRPQNRVMFCARMDEAGFIVTNIDENGFIQFECIGKVDSRVVIGRRVLIGDCAVPALVGSKALHMLDKSEDGVLADTDKLYFDIGADSKEQAERRVHIGDRAVFEGSFLEFGDGFAMGKALEGRAGCAALLELLSAPAEYDFCACFAVRKEIEGAGCGPAAFTLAPDIAVVVDGASAGDIPAVSGDKRSCSLGKGVVTAFKDGRTLYDTTLCRRLSELCEANEIPIQVKRNLSEYSLGEDIHAAKGGVRTICAEYPVRYARSSGAVLKISDLEHEVKLLEILSMELAAI